VVAYYNKLSLKNKIDEKLLETYFPEIRKFKIKTNIFGKLLSVQKSNMAYNVEEFNIFRKESLKLLE